MRVFVRLDSIKFSRCIRAQGSTVGVLRGPQFSYPIGRVFGVNGWGGGFILSLSLSLSLSLPLSLSLLFDYIESSLTVKGSG